MPISVAILSAVVNCRRNAFETELRYTPDDERDCGLQTLAPLAGRARDEQADACRAFLTAAHARIREAHFAGAPGDVTARAWSDAADEVVRALFRAARRRAPGPRGGARRRRRLRPRRALPATATSTSGSWCRAARPATGARRRWPRRSSIRCGTCAWRSATPCAPSTSRRRWRARIWPPCTALLDARFLDGRQAPSGTSSQREVPRLFERDVNGVVERLAEEKNEPPRALRRHGVPARAQREERAGRLSRSARRAVGGQGALPRARLRSDLRDARAGSPRQVAGAHRRAPLLPRACARPRTSRAKRKQDRLTFEMQEAIAPRLLPASASRRTTRAWRARSRRRSRR